MPTYGLEREAASAKPFLHVSNQFASVHVLLTSSSFHSSIISQKLELGRLGFNHDFWSSTKTHLEAALIAFSLRGNSSPHHSVQCDDQSWLLSPYHVSLQRAQPAPGPKVTAPRGARPRRRPLHVQMNRYKGDKNSGLTNASSSKDPIHPWQWKQQLQGSVPPPPLVLCNPLPAFIFLPTVLETFLVECLVWSPSPNVSPARPGLPSAVITATCPALGTSSALQMLAII